MSLNRLWSVCVPDTLPLRLNGLLVQLVVLHNQIVKKQEARRKKQKEERLTHEVRVVMDLVPIRGKREGKNPRFTLILSTADIQQQWGGIRG